jgi:hypothetical protein
MLIELFSSYKYVSEEMTIESIGSMFKVHSIGTDFN